ncbi:AMP-binding protein [Georgenia sp. EYE_87]|uniref:long-chain-fatty-acid--CoA ligase n=1 Tax=Georgenia sp. EYE_87 TaxID=2853448 RepID=UPI002003A5DC|nr:long-chain-fatty-acid--CoA ligase [Georgenia sp. EYE_87]MCK6211380.1 AMP-binding protein [Georgenia sp. EYE_87]
MSTTPRPWVRYYHRETPAEIELPTTSLVEMFERAVKEGGRAPATEFFGRRHTYAELGEMVERAAEGLRRLGVRHGDRVALILPNCPQHVVAFYAVLRLGAVVVEHNPLYTSRELRHLFESHGARVVIAWDSAVAKIEQFPDDVEIDHVVAVNLLDEFPATLRAALRLPLGSLRKKRRALTSRAPGAMPWKELVDARRIDRRHPRPAVDDLAVVQYTSGTTGRAKGAMLTHLNLYANALQGAAWMVGARQRKEVNYAILPMFHAFGMTIYLTFGILKQSLLVLFPTPDVDLVLKAAKKTPPTVFSAVPPIYRKTAEAAKKRGVSLRSAKFCISGAMALTNDVVELWESVAGGKLVEGYGMTESSPVAFGNPFNEHRRTGTIGVPFPSTDMLVVEVDDPSREVAPGQPGELLISGPQVFKGYWQDPEATAQALLPGGWLRTGDVVTVDADGFTTIVDRAKELIITGGFNVSPSEVEEAVRTHPDVADAAVVGLPQADGGETIVAVVVLADGATLDEESVREHCRHQLARYKVPKRVVAVDALPKSMLGKVLRKQVRDELPARL